MQKHQQVTQDVPDGVKGWNWGAFLLTWIWGASHRVWVSLWGLIPIVNIFMAFYLGAKGNELAWRKGHWESVAAFRLHQRHWAIAAVIFIAVGTVLGIVFDS